MKKPKSATAGRHVVLAYYHCGFTDEGPRLLAVCDSHKSASVVIEKHKRERNKEAEFENKATWMTEETIVRYAR